MCFPQCSSCLCGPLGVFHCIDTAQFLAPGLANCSRSPSPPPSPAGRGSRFARSAPTRTLPLCRTRPTILPFPAGEGRGEGEQPLKHHPAPNKKSGHPPFRRHCPRSSAVIPAMHKRQRTGAVQNAPASTRPARTRASVLECASPLALSPCTARTPAPPDSSSTRQMVLPLPVGEGWGEGERVGCASQAMLGPQDQPQKEKRCAPAGRERRELVPGAWGTGRTQPEKENGRLWSAARLGKGILRVA